MQENEITNLLEDDGMLLRNLFACEPEIEALQKMVAKHIGEVEELAKSNQETKQELKKVASQYEDRMVQYESLKQANMDLEQEQKVKCISKKQIVDLLNQKIKTVDHSTKDLEK